MRQWAIEQSDDCLSTQYSSVNANKATQSAAALRPLNANLMAFPAFPTLDGAGDSCSIREYQPRKRAMRVDSFNPINNDSQSLWGSMEDDDDAVPAVRLSRHIPQREGVDMTVSTYNLIGIPTSTPTQGLPGMGNSGSRIGNTSPIPGGIHAQPFTGNSFLASTASSSMYTSLSDSQISDDSSYMTSLYNDMLAEKLANRDSNTNTASMGHNNPVIGNGIGGEVFRFGSETANGDQVRPRHGNHDSSARASAVPSTQFSRQLHHPGFGGRNGGQSQRAICANPERVLDAPEFPVDATQLLHWGANNKLIIGLKNSLYAWDADTTESSKMLELVERSMILCVRWLHKCSCVAIGGSDGSASIYDCRTNEFIRTVRVQTDQMISGIAINGPIMALASKSSNGSTSIFDLRIRNALISTFEGAGGPVSSLQYCTAEPYYLATGHEDGHVRVWDARRSSSPRYAFDAVHQGPVSALHWNPERRSKLFTGGTDGILCLVDTHALVRTMEDDAMADEEAVSTQPRSEHFITRAVKTMFPITGIECNGSAGELVTSHCGKGQLQLRSMSTFHLGGILSAPNNDAGISCMTLAPDKERVCAAQADETLKFWRVFDNSSIKKMAQGRAAAHYDPFSPFSQQLR